MNGTDVLIGLHKTPLCAGNPDFRLLKLICDNGYDGWIRVVNNTEDNDIVKWVVDSSDEVALCDATTKVTVTGVYPYLVS